MVEIVEVRSYTIPYCRNKYLLPYADLLISNGTCKKWVKTKEDRNGTYFTFERKRYYIQNTKLGVPKFDIVREGRYK